MNENEDYTHVQRRLCEVMAKSEWTSSRMRMQKSGEELRERRAKSHRSANKFLQDLFDKRTDGDLIDDNGVVDRYHKFLKYKSALNDDTNSSLDEFDRRLRALNSHRRNQTIKSKHFKNNPQSSNDKNDIIQIQDEDPTKPSRKLPNISNIPITSTPNATSRSELTTSVSRDDEIQELSRVKSTSLSFIDSEANHIETSSSLSSSLLLDKTGTLNSIPSLNNLLTSSVYTPKVCRTDGTEIVVSSSISPLGEVSSNVLLFNHCCFPRSLTSRGKINSNLISKRQLPSLPSQQSTTEQKQIQTEQFDTNQLYDFLDHLDNKSQEFSSENFIHKLDQLKLTTTAIIHPHQLSSENLSLINSDYHEEEETHILPNLFDETSSSTQEKLFYTISNINIDDSENISLYTMTLSTVQLSPSLLLPYSMLNGRRPLLESSNQTNFKQIRSKYKKSTYQVTAIESCLNLNQLEQNDILLKINNQSVWGLTTDEINQILKQTNSCSLTIARLSQPFV